MMCMMQEMRNRPHSSIFGEYIARNRECSLLCKMCICLFGDRLIGSLESSCHKDHCLCGSNPKNSRGTGNHYRLDIDWPTQADKFQVSWWNRCCRFGRILWLSQEKDSYFLGILQPKGDNLKNKQRIIHFWSKLNNLFFREHIFHFLKKNQ